MQQCCFYILLDKNARIRSTTTVIITSNSSVSSEQTYTFVIQGNGTLPSPEIDIVDTTNNNPVTDGSANSPSVINSTSYGSTDTLNPVSNSFTIENVNHSMRDCITFTQNDTGSLDLPSIYPVLLSLSNIYLMTD